jgi:hypothetical protein
MRRARNLNVFGLVIGMRDIRPNWSWGESLTRGSEGLNEFLSGADGATLLASPRPNSALPRAAREVLITFLSGRFNDDTFYPYLTVQVVPVEYSGRARVYREFSALVGLVVCKKDNDTGREDNVLAQHNACAWLALKVCAG